MNIFQVNDDGLGMAKGHFPEALSLCRHRVLYGEHISFTSLTNEFCGKFVMSSLENKSSRIGLRRYRAGVIVAVAVNLILQYIIM